MNLPLLAVSPAQALGMALKERHWLFASAESCTGGLVAAAMTAEPGSSAWFERGFVTYSNQAKVQELGVHAETLERFGAVSEATAIEMAAGLLTACASADLAVSTTGIAGPDGATPGKPVGLVCFGFAQRTPDGIVTRAISRIFAGDRSSVRAQAVDFALEQALLFLNPI
ncbi:CinA family protein [Alcaligenes endophyticus]|uniref:Nicotinamide-nucleotide amidohydrolase family protein n=1 Tax=Alcaligenes endophyticus TaxID=1929088 RepID=A0ABT8EMC6_9BURK|nr:nicotinamide-nucleotide amidohydrolase family protein [Alcaligenes endophyticus]MCX5590966.1 nicotinamide-nucleotide amidohydrolase family protein [Alcaligenes endophyticus]MDN4122457.1 nicotinamide-nucleotide amidohydrolase family protein [Alcaligenes endophyticus]